MSTPSARDTALVLDDPVFRHFWYPVARLDALADGPVARRLLGEELVLWSPRPGEVAAARDRCPHRDARLSTGWLDECRLVCPYHGWQFDEQGTAVHVPQLGLDARIPPKADLRSVASCLRYGWVWVALEEPLLPIPEIPEFDAPGWRTISEPESDWACTAVHLVDNNIDPAHIAFVHQASFGTPARPEVDLPGIEWTAAGMHLTYEVAVESRPGEVGTTVRSTRNQLHGPLLMLNRITYPDGVVHLMVKACTPATATTTHQLQLVLRNDAEEQRPAADIVAFDDQVWAEDKAVLEHCWTDYRLEITDNVHLRTDRASIEYRRWLARLVASGADAIGGPA